MIVDYGLDDVKIMNQLDSFSDGMLRSSDQPLDLWIGKKRRLDRKSM